MLTKETANKLISYMPDMIPFDEAKKIFYRLEKMIEEQKETGKEIDWEDLKEEIARW